MLKISTFRATYLAAAALLAASCLLAAPRPAHAQALVMSVNGRPITTYDIEQRMKLLHLLKKPASREAALDDLVADAIKLDELAKFTIHLENNDIMAQGAQDAQEAKIAPAAFAGLLKSAGIDENNWRDHFKAQAEWNLYVKAMNKTLDVSESAVNAALSKDGKSAGITEYLVRQVVIVVPNQNAMDQRMPEADQLRARFDGCAAGVAMARTMPNVVVQALVNRPSTSLTDQAKDQLAKTDVGRLTAPERTPEGIQMIALCSKKIVRDDSATQPIRDQLIKDRLQRASDELYAPLRKRAVIVRLHS